MITSFLSILPAVGFVILIVGIAFFLTFIFCPVKYDVRASNEDCVKASIRTDFVFKMLSLEIFLKKKEKLITKIKLCLFGKILWQSGLGKKKKRKKAPLLPEDKNTPPKESVIPKTEASSEEIRPNVRRIKMSEAKKIPQEEKSLPQEEKEDSLLKKILKMPDKGKLLKAIFTLIKELFAEIKPDYVYVRGILGTGDPCKTGQYTGLIYAVSGYFAADVQIVPDFENVIYKGKARLTGSVRLYRIIYIGLKFITQKPVRNLIKILRKGKRD